jgi:defect-in-organelle-trafficking protein DotC
MQKLKGHLLINSVLLTAILGLSACGPKTLGPYAGTTETLEGLQAMGRAGPPSSSEQKSNIRVLAIKETAYSIGAQSGLAYRAKYINAYLITHSRQLDKIYDFENLILENNVLPPILSEGRNAFNLASPNAIRVANTTYQIDRQAQFVTTAPNWRQYIWLDYKIPDRPHFSVLPKDAEERVAWDKYTYEGWQKGMEQADEIFSNNLARLKHDFVGMIRYRKLLAMNMVSPPYVSHTDLGVTGDNNQLRIDDRVLRIVALPGLKPNSKEWRASVTKLDGRLEKFNKLEKLASKTKIEITDQAWQPVIPAAD